MMLEVERLSLAEVERVVTERQTTPRLLQQWLGDRQGASEEPTAQGASEEPTANTPLL